MTVDDFPLVHPAEVVACALTCLDELDAICVADAALNHGDTTKEEIAELLVGRYSKAARLRLDQADAAARSHVETRTRLCLRETGLRVETGVVLEGIGEVDALVEGLSGEVVHLAVTGPLEKPVESRFGFLPESHTAVIEMADAAGLPLVPEGERDPRRTTTYGLGELMLAAIDRGCRDFILGIGGSATNDCGLGMLTALGARFFDAAGKAVGRTGGDVAAVRRIDLAGLHPALKECRIHVACDVTNPLYGPLGCSHVYGPQKGAMPEIVEEMDAAIRAFAGLAGAAGGLGFAFHSFLKAELKPGITLVLDALGIEKALADADILLTGEGRMDRQTAMGKAPVGVAKLAKMKSPKLKAIALCSCALPDA